MEYINYILIGLFVYFIMTRLLAAKGVRQITTTELKSELNNNTKQFVDVRTPAEFMGKHIKGFKNVPLYLLAKTAERELSKEREVIVLCQSGMRSKKASKMLKKLGYNVTNVKGGMGAWRN